MPDNLTFASFQTVVHILQNNIPKSVLRRTITFTLEDDRHHCITVERPCPFDDYGDVVAQVTLYKGDEVLLKNLITYNTDLNKFCEKLLKKLNIDRLELFRC